MKGFFIGNRNLILVLAWVRGDFVPISAVLYRN